MSKSTKVDQLDELIAPIDAYLARAANRPIDTPIEQRLLTTLPVGNRLALPAALTFFNDISHYQPVVDGTYPYPVLSARISSGWSLDDHIKANWAVARKSNKIQVFLGYVVFIPGQLDVVMAHVKSVFGAKLPAKVALMIDMESGPGFAGHGDHSVEANQWVAAFAKYAGSSKRVVAYANHYDFIENWSGLSSRIKRITASYGTTDPGTWGWQYAGGNPRWPSAVGFPRTAPPFGSYVDFNVVARTLNGIKSDLGIASPPKPKPVPKPVPKYKTYTVRNGDSLSSIAAKFNTSWPQLVAWNKAAHPSLSSHPDFIQINWLLRVSK